MSEYKKFKRSVTHHPGVKVAAMLTLIFTYAGTTGPNGGISGALLGAGVSLFFWAIVLTTAWTGRNIQ